MKHARFSVQRRAELLGRVSDCWLLRNAVVLSIVFVWFVILKSPVSNSL